MKGLIVVGILISLLVVQVSAVGIGLPQSVTDGKMTISVGNTDTLEFVLKGDASSKTVDFFANIDAHVATLNGDYDYVHSVSLPVYGEKKVTVAVKGTSGGTGTVRYGYKIDGSSGSGIGMGQTVQDTFVLTVQGSSSSSGGGSSTTTTSRSSSGGGGGGGGGGVVLKVNTTTAQPVVNATVVPPLPSSPPSVTPNQTSGVQMADLAGESGLAEGVVDTFPSVVPNVLPEVSGAGDVSSTGGRVFGILTLGVLFTTLLLNGMVLRMAKREASE